MWALVAQHGEICFACSHCNVDTIVGQTQGIAPLHPAKRQQDERLLHWTFPGYRANFRSFGPIRIGSNNNYAHACIKDAASAVGVSTDHEARQHAAECWLLHRLHLVRLKAEAFVRRCSRLCAGWPISILRLVEERRCSCVTK